MPYNPLMRFYYVEGQGWFVVKTANKKRAYSVGVAEFGRGNVSCVRTATQEEVSRFVSEKGEAALEE